MNEDSLNTTIRKFLKTLGVTGQREIEKAVRQALADGRLKGNEKLPAKATITIAAVGLSHVIEDTISWSETQHTAASERARYPAFEQSAGLRILC